MPAPQISPLPTPPSRSQSPETFSTDADAFLGAFPDFQAEANDQADYLDALAVDVTADAAAAEAAAAIATGAANYQGDYSAGTTYQIGESVSYNGRRYVAKTVNTGVTPADGANWFLINDGDVLGPISATNNSLAAFDGTTGKLIKAAGTVSVEQGGTGVSSLTENAVLVGNGTSAIGSIAAGASGNVLTSDGTTWASIAPPPSGPTLEAIASGTLADGSTVIVNADGTVSMVAGPTGSPVVFSSGNTLTSSAVYDANTQKVVIAYAADASLNGTAIVGTVSGTSISFGTPVTFFSAGQAQFISAVYDANTQKIVIAYRDQYSTGFGFAIVGTVSGTSISFGAAVAFASSNAQNISATYDSFNQKVVIAYRNLSNSNYGTAVVGTVSGTSISFGTAVVFESAATSNISTTYHSVQEKVVIAYRDDGNSNFGTAIVGTVSGTSISFGTAVVLESTGTALFSSVYDSTQQKVVIAWQRASDGFGRAVVGTVSGTSISFGTVASFTSTQANSISATYNANAQKVVIAYGNAGNSTFGTFIFGTVSGTSISFGTAVVFESANTDNISCTYDSVQQKVVIAYRDVGNSNYGTSIVVQSDTSTLTAENFIGFSNAAYTNGQTATIQIVGSVDDAQSGLTPGQSYFVQANGSLGLTAGSPSVFAGTAVSATKIIVKG